VSPVWQSIPTGAGLDDGVALPQRALIDPEEGELTIAALIELEGVGNGLCFRIRLQLDRCAVLIEIDGLDRHIGGIGQVAGDGIHHGLNALVLVGRTHEDGRQLEGKHAFSHRLVDELGRRIVLEGGLHEFV